MSWFPFWWGTGFQADIAGFFQPLGNILFPISSENCIVVLLSLLCFFPGVYLWLPKLNNCAPLQGLSCPRLPVHHLFPGSSTRASLSLDCIFLGKVISYFWVWVWTSSCSVWQSHVHHYTHSQDNRESFSGWHDGSVGRMLAAKPKGLRSSPRIHIAEGEKQCTCEHMK